VTRPFLTELFATLNRSHFAGRLPAYTVRRLPFTAAMAVAASDGAPAAGQAAS
jgi:hypothetical protein